MDVSRFAAFARLIDQAQPRRATLHRGMTALAMVAGGLALMPVDAKKKKRKKTCKKPKPPTCAASCHAACEFCFHRADGPLLCGSIVGGGAPPCDVPCSSDNDCVGSDQPYCITLLEDRETGQTQQPCPEPGAWCFGFSTCVA